MAMISATDAKAPRLLGLKEAAAELGMSTWTLRDLVGSGALRAVQPPGVRRILIDRKDLERAIEAWKQ
jgi:excisionase family DNA binding protein